MAPFEPTVATTAAPWAEASVNATGPVSTVVVVATGAPVDVLVPGEDIAGAATAAEATAGAAAALVSAFSSLMMSKASIGESTPVFVTSR